MAMIRKTSDEFAYEIAAKINAESGADAAMERLSKPVAAPKPAYKARDYDAEALGKTRCVQFEAALMSPAIAGMKFDTMEEYLKLVRQAAEAGVAFSFEK